MEWHGWRQEKLVQELCEGDALRLVWTLNVELAVCGGFGCDLVGLAVLFPGCILPFAVAITVYVQSKRKSGVLTHRVVNFSTM
jgi:hypothetical protein